MRSNGANFYRMATDALAEMFVIEDADGLLVWANNAAVSIYPDLTGGRQLVVGKPVRERLPMVIDEQGLAVDSEQQLHRLALGDRSPLEKVIRGVQIADEVRWFSCRAVPMADPETGEPCVVHSWTEITEQRRVAADLERQERHLRTALEYGPIGMGVVGADGRFIEVNPSFCRLGGWEHDALIGLEVAAITHPEDIAADHAMVTSMLEGRHESYQLEKRYIGADGSPIPVRVVVALVRTPDGGHTFITQCVDISAQKRVEAAQIEALRKERQLVADLREVERIRADFVATASHELRTPVVSLLGFLELMGEELSRDFSPSEMRSLIEAATRNGNRLQKLIDDLLAVARVESGGLPRESEPVSVSALVASVGEIMSIIAQQSLIDLDIEIDDSVGWIIGDAEQLERVLVNIVGNALKFTPSGGSVRLSATCCSHAPDLVVIEVVDSGIGIPSSEQELLFTRFFRSSNAREAAVAGTGLGLAIAAEIVDAHDGTISVTSSSGVGSTFTIRLPRSAVRQPRPE